MGGGGGGGGAWDDGGGGEGRAWGMRDNEVGWGLGCVGKLDKTCSVIRTKKERKRVSVRW